MTEFAITGLSLVVGGQRKDFAFAAWHNSDGPSRDATAGQLLDHLRDVHGYRGALSADRDELDVVHRGDHSYNGEVGAHERKDIGSATGAGTSMEGGPQFGLAPVSRGAPVTQPRRRTLRQQRLDTEEEPQGKAPAPRSGRPKPRGGPTLLPLRKHKR